MALRITILGCGSSGGVPRTGGDWGACDPAEPKNRRSRCSILIEKTNTSSQIATTVLVDTSPDLRNQLLAANVRHVDGVLYTHEHADQTHGIDDLRPLVFANGKVAQMYMDARTRTALYEKFGYIFKTPKNSDYPPIATETLIEAGTPVRIDGPGGVVEAMPYLQRHGRIDSLGFRIGDIAYSNDLVELDEASYQHLEGLDVLIVDALRYNPHPTHFNVEQALELVARLKPKRAILTNMHVDLDYNTLCAELPEGVEPAYDGMIIESAAD